MKNIKIIAIAFFTLILVGCVKDSGNYSYNEIPEFKIEDITIQLNGKSVPLSSARKIIVSTTDKLAIDINGDFSLDAKGSYSWKLFPKKSLIKPQEGDVAPIEISTTKKLDFTVNQGPGAYIIYFEAINNEKGTSFLEKFELEVSSINGLLVYYVDADGKGDYSAVRTAQIMPELTADKLGITDNIYSAVNGGAKIENPTNIWLRTNYNSDIENKILLASTNNVTVINYDTHNMQSNDYSSLFFLPIEDVAAPQGHMVGEQAEFLVQNGELRKIDYSNPPSKIVFGIHCGTAGCNYSPQMMSIEGDYFAEIPREALNIMFNLNLRKFEYHNYLGMMEFGFVDGNVDIRDTQRDLLYVGKGLGLVMNAVMKTDDGKIEFVTFNLADNNAVTSSSIDVSADASESSKWAISTRSELAYFTSGDKIKLLSKKSGLITTSSITIPAGAEITALSLLNDSDNPTYDNALLFVAYVVDGEGVLLQYQFNSLTGVVDTASKEQFDGFGRILNVVLKK